MNAKETIQALGQEKAGKLMADLYGSLKTAENRTRYEKLVCLLYTSPSPRD